MRHWALNLLKTDTSVKASIHTKRLKAGWDDTYLIQLLPSTTAADNQGGWPVRRI
jgi:hypothetical protein